MQLIFQIPIIDLRRSIKGLETIDVWPSPRMAKEDLDALMKKSPFIRNFGKIESEADGYCCSINCIKMGNKEDLGFRIRGHAVPVFNFYKLLLAGGAYTFNAELGFTDSIEAFLAGASDKESVHIADLLNHYMSMPIEIQQLDYISGDEWISVPLGDLPNIIAKNYNRATATNRAQPPSDEYVTNGEVCLTLTYAADERIVIPPNAEKLDEFSVSGNTVQLYGYKWIHENRTYKIWLFRVPTLNLMAAPLLVSVLDNKRRSLFRINAEKEAVRIVMNGFDPASADASMVSFIKKTPIKLYKKNRFDSNLDSVRKFALQSEQQNVKFVTLEEIKKLLDDYGLANLKNLEANMMVQQAKKKILFITSNPTDTNPIDFGEQFKKITEAWKSGSDREYFNVPTIESGVEREKVMEILYTQTPDYLHITLHASEIKGLYFQDNTRKPDPMSAEEFSDYMQELNKIKAPQAVILCACNSLAHATAVQAFCKFAMGTNYVFPDNAGIVYATKFYTALFNGKSVDFCHRVAIQGIKYSKPPFEAIDDKEVYDIPQLIFLNKPS